MRHSTCLFFAALATFVNALGQATASAQLVPLDVTGFNRDVIVEVGSEGPPYSTAQSFDRWDHIATAMYEEGLVDGRVGLLPNG